ncbi:MAG: hypothetical protein P4M11_15875 [Candidatus Pacebacteria bacterium]|nr:hypothetical protein [Candidatus Paceibacterota bacterium]
MAREDIIRKEKAKEQQAEQMKQYRKHISMVKAEVAAQLKASSDLKAGDYSNPYIVAEMHLHARGDKRVRHHGSPRQDEQQTEVSTAANKTSSMD